MFEQSSQVMSSEQLADGVFSLRLFADRIAQAARPGQFVHVRCGTDREFILRRPFSIHGVSGQTIDILFDVRGKGTRALARMRQHDVLDVLGPLGRGFTVKPGVKRALLVAGGMGVAPLSLLAEELSSRAARVYIAYGVKTKSRALRLVELKRLAREVSVATDDGTLGERGPITELLPSLVHQVKPDAVYACGPEPMLREVVRITRPYDVPCEVSLEALMACGVGACLSCAVRTTGGIRHVCSDGPVFEAGEVVWEW